MSKVSTNHFKMGVSIVFGAGVMQATTMSGSKLEKRYSPSFHEDPNRKPSASKRKRDDVLRLVLIFFFKFKIIIQLCFTIICCTKKSSLR